MKLTDKTTCKIFIGCHFTSEMKMHLSKNRAWKLNSVIPVEMREIQIQEIPFQGKEYLGLYMLTDHIDMAELQKIKTSIQSLIKHYCPEYLMPLPKVYVFPQIFVA